MKHWVTNYKLCYIEGGLAYFLNIPPTDAWGDDWNDVPYEHNAGTPYLTITKNGALFNNGTDVEIDQVIIAFRSNYLQTPAELAVGNNSDYSVEMINSGHIAWLSTDKYYTKTPVSIPAGTTVHEFIQKIHDTGGEVYIPMRLAPCYGAPML